MTRAVPPTKPLMDSTPRPNRYGARPKIHLPVMVMENQMTRQPIYVEDDKKPLKPKADDQSHESAKHIEETARLASSVQTAKDPGKVRLTKD